MDDSTCVKFEIRTNVSKTFGPSVGDCLIDESVGSMIPGSEGSNIPVGSW